MAKSASQAAGLCIFDIDGTLTRQRNATAKSCGSNQPLPWDPPCRECVGAFPAVRREIVGKHSYPAPYALPGIQACMANNYQVGVATARPCDGATVQARLHWLQRLGAPASLVTPDGKPGPNFMCAAAPGKDNVLKKSGAIKTLMDRYNVPAERTIFYDDVQRALTAAKASIPGLKTQMASTHCKGKWCAEGCGLSKKEFEAGFAKTIPHPSHKH
eukprot:PhM_4_TR7977/c0_g1_i1/m.103716